MCLITNDIISYVTLISDVILITHNHLQIVTNYDLPVLIRKLIDCIINYDHNVGYNPHRTHFPHAISWR